MSYKRKRNRILQTPKRYSEAKCKAPAYPRAETHRDT